MNDAGSTAASAELRAERDIQTIVASAVTCLDAEEFSSWLAHFGVDAEYEISAYSSELRRPMSWWKSDKPNLQKILDEVDRHERERARRLHVLGPTLVDLDAAAAHATTPFALYRTLPSGESSLYVVGRYEAELRREDERWRYVRQHVKLETRVLDALTHVPI